MKTSTDPGDTKSHEDTVEVSVARLLGLFAKGAVSLESLIALQVQFTPRQIARYVNRNDARRLVSGGLLIRDKAHLDGSDSSDANPAVRLGVTRQPTPAWGQSFLDRPVTPSTSQASRSAGSSRPLPERPFTLRLDLDGDLGSFSLDSPVSDAQATPTQAASEPSFSAEDTLDSIRSRVGQIKNRNPRG